ncbi:MAG: DNA primase [Beijerinckiaceae bacterium]|jgi:DNA primase
MRFPPSFLDEIKARLPVSDVVRRHVKLMKSGREWKGLSPFGAEKTPSFFVNDQKMAWFDFSSGKNGNIFDFVMATEGLSFPETVERLARDAGLELPERSPEAERQEIRRAGLHEVLDLAAQFFESQLRGERGARARAYLTGRGIALDIQKQFRLGYASAERHALRDALAAKGASAETMIEAGLLIHGEDIPVPYDRFRDRVMFPIADRNGRVIAFGGRAMEKDVPAKYLNSPETPLFHKGAVLYNHHQARKAAHDRGRVIAVEGYIDVIAMHAAGFPETVAPLGTALTPDQGALLWGMSSQPILCFDGDSAGRKAAFRAADMALPLIGPEKTLAFALLPEGQDPDDIVRAAGPGAVEEVLRAALPLVDLLWSRQMENRALTTPEHRASLERDLAETVAAIKDEALRRYYKAEFDQRLKALFGTPERTFERRNQNGPRRGGPGRGASGGDRLGYLSSPIMVSASLTQSPAFRPSAASFPAREALILTLLLAQPNLIADHAEDLAGVDFSAKEAGPLRDAMLDLVHDDIPLSSSLRAALGNLGFDATLAKLDRVGPAFGWYSHPDAALADADAVLRQALTLHRKARALHRELLSAEAALALDASDANFARMRDIQEQLSALAGTEAAVEGFGASSGRPKPAI